MNLETAIDKLVKHPEIKGVVFGVVPDDGNFRLDAFCYISEKDFEKSVEPFMKYRKFVLKEVK